MSVNKNHRVDFVKRLKQACEANPIIPGPNLGRQVFIAKRLGVSNESVNKWFNATAMPRPAKMQELASLLGVDVAWLSLGIHPEVEKKERKEHGRHLEAAVQLTYGTMSFAGIRCGIPTDSDPRSEYVDFYAMVGTSVYPVRVTLAREVGPDMFEFYVIPEYKEVRLIGVVPLGTDGFHFIDLPTEKVDEFKQEKAPSYRIMVERKAGSSAYKSENYTWPIIRSFSEFR